MNKDIKSISAEIKQISETGEFEAVIATLNVIDADGDIIVAGAFGDATISIMPAHDHSSVPLGKATMEDRGDKAVAVGKFNLDIQSAKDWFKALKFDLENGKSVQEWSFGFRIKDSEEETRDGEPVRILKRLDVMEISPVLRGAGVDTRTLDVKSQKLSDQFDKACDEIDDLIKRWTDLAKMRAGKEKSKQLSEANRKRIKTLREKLAAFDKVLDLAKVDDLSPEAKVLTNMAIKRSFQHIA